MSGINLVADLLKRRCTYSAGLSSKSLFSNGVLSATVAASVAGISASRAILSDVGGATVAFCDAGVAWKDDYIPDLRSASEKIFLHDSIKYNAKQYPIELKPLFSAFGLKTLAITSLRSFLLFYLPLLEPRPPADEEEDDDTLQDPESVDLQTPFKKSVKQIARETTVITTRRILERLAVHHVSRRVAWKLLKDVPRSAKRKALRGWSSPFFLYSVSRTTFRGQLLAVLATWLVQIGMDVYHCLFSKTNDSDEELDSSEKLRLLAKKVSTSTGRCCASLIFASIIGGIGALFHPSIGQWVGCAIGDFTGPLVVTICLEKISDASS